MYLHAAAVDIIMTCDIIVDVTDVSLPPDQNTDQWRNKSG